MGVSVLRGQGVGLPTVKVSFWPGVRKQTALLKRLAVGLHGEDLDEMNHILARFAS